MDQLEPEKEVENFANEYGTGNSVSEPADFLPSGGSVEPDLPGSPIIRLLQHVRVTKRTQQPGYVNDAAVAPLMLIPSMMPQAMRRAITSTVTTVHRGVMMARHTHRVVRRPPLKPARPAIHHHLFQNPLMSIPQSHLYLLSLLKARTNLVCSLWQLRALL